MKVKIIISAIIFYAGIITSSFSQSDLRHGYVITLENDTINGQLDYRSNLNNYKSCVFIGEQEGRKYYPHEIKGFGYYNDKFYASQIIEGSFVEALVIGDISLYKSKDKYHLKKDTSIYDLESIHEKVRIDGKVYLRENNTWRGIISYLIGDCINNTNNVVSNIDLNEKSLTRLIVQYNQCKDSEFKEYKVKKPWIKYDFGATVGLSRSEIRITKYSETFLYLDDLYSSIDPSIGVLFGFSSPRIKEKIAFQGEIHYIKSSYSSLVVINNVSSTEYHDTYIDLRTLSMPLSLKYSFPEKKYGLYLQGGINYDYHLSASSRLMTEIVTGNLVNTSAERSAIEIKNNQIGYWGGIGIQKSYQKFKASLAVRYFEMSVLNRPGYGYFMANNRRIVINLILLKK